MSKCTADDKMASFRLPFLVFLLALAGCSTAYRTVVYSEREGDALSLREGILSTSAQRIRYRRGAKTVAVVTLSEPVLVARAEQEEGWGYFQFPKLGVTADGTLLVSWQMKADSPRMYGSSSGREWTPMMSRDGGKTWVPQDRPYEKYVHEYNVRLPEGLLQIATPPARRPEDFPSFPDPVAEKGGRRYYAVDQLPQDLQGAYLSLCSGGRTTPIHAKVDDPGLLRCTLEGTVPVVWWGDMKALADGSLVAGVYPCYYLDEAGEVMPCGVSFYRSADAGHSWTLLGKIPSLGWDEVGGDGGFVEPTFEVLPDSTFLCVMRTGSPAPMYRSFSYDRGVTWTTPEPFTPNGVKPQLLLLEGGVLALVSGRPGIQVRLSLDGSGRDWTNPIDMIPFMRPDGSYIRDVSCGYPAILEGPGNTFRLVYSDFTTLDDQGRPRKSIWFREVKVSKIK